MTSTTIQDMLFPVPAMTAQNTKTAAVKDGGFGDMFAKQTVQAPETTKKASFEQKESASQETVKEPSYRQRGTKDVQSISKQEDTSPKQVEELDEEELEDAAALLEETGAELLTVLAQLFDTTPADLEAALEEQDMAPEQLLDITQLNQFLQDFEGVTDSLELLTNADLYESMKEAGNAAQEFGAKLAEKLDVAPEELPKLMEAVETFIEAKQPSQDETVIPDIAAADEEQAVQTLLQTQRKPNEPVVVMQQDERIGRELPKTETTDEREPTQGVANADETQDKQPVGKEEGLSQESGNEGDNDSGQTAQSSQAVKEPARREHVSRHAAEHAEFATDFRTAAALGETQAAESTQTQGYTETRTADIMRQIMDFMRISVRPDMSSLELQLHPASLGNVQVQIGNRAGLITAQFITQNEAVKAALEGQMIELQERFEEQGIKVEAIEVSVQTNSFDQNLEQQNSRNQETLGRPTAKSRRIRLDASMTPEELELLGEDEKLAVSMMEANGNTVDYMA